jgi:2'-5' RNA ligase
MRYILALLPSDQQKMAFIRAAQAAFSQICDGYLLKDGMSLPHITLCSFQCDDRKLNEICKSVEKWQTYSCPVRTMGLMFKKGKVPPYHYSVSLSIACESPILNLHHVTLKLLKDLNINTLNPSEDLYFPHLTLAGIRWSPSADISLASIIDDLIAMPLESFQLALGRGDDIGQYLETISAFQKTK